jgi:hypothetical protein
MRKIEKLYKGRRSKVGAGVKLTRVFSFYDAERLDPFLLLDFFDSKNPDEYKRGLPWHPHRGMETITYLIHGRIDHGDSLGNNGIIEPLGCQWMTAGRGVLHQEMPQKTPWILGCQLWLNLPKSKKLTKPVYREITEKDLAIYEDDQVHIKVISGAFKRIKGPIRGRNMALTYFDVTVFPGKTFSWQIEKTKQCFILRIEGELSIAGEIFETRGALLTMEEEIRIEAQLGGRFFLIAAEPLKEPVAWQGSIVMNTQKEVEEAYHDLEEGTFTR